MIKIAIKHYIYEICINILFENILFNFKRPDCFMIGERYKLIALIQPDQYIELRRCAVARVEPDAVCVYVEQYLEFDDSGGVRGEYNNTGILWSAQLDEIVKVIR